MCIVSSEGLSLSSGHVCRQLRQVDADAIPISHVKSLWVREHFKSKELAPAFAVTCDQRRPCGIKHDENKKHQPDKMIGIDREDATCRESLHYHSLGYVRHARCYFKAKRYTQQQQQHNPS